MSDLDLDALDKEHDGRFTVFPKEVARTLIAEARRARALEAYTSHRGDCVYFEPWLVGAERPCSCGLSALLHREDERG